MKKDSLNDLAAFVAVAEERSFTRAAAKLGMSPSGLSHSMKALEDRLGVQLLLRTTRYVALTRAGTQLLDAVGSPLDEIQQGLILVSDLRESPAGKIRIAASMDGMRSVLWPILPEFKHRHSDLDIEVGVQAGLVDLSSNRFDAGITVGDNLDKDLAAVRVSPEIKIVIVGSPDYLARQGIPETPKDLLRHECINYRRHSGMIFSWDLVQNGKPLQLSVRGSLTFNDPDIILAMALGGHGLAYCFKHLVSSHIRSGGLVPVLEDACPTMPGYYLYHPHRRYVPKPLAILIDTLAKRSDHHAEWGD